MRSYYPKSWTQQARKMADNQIEQILDGEITRAEATRFFADSYHAPIIRYRAAKRFGREMRKNNSSK